MKISICIPQYNRAKLLVKALRMLENQTYDNIEIIISDDCSTDDTIKRITDLKKVFKFPIILGTVNKNTGYDRNYRKCIELATGDYAFVIGNDDTLYDNNSIEYLVNFLKENDFPDIGYCNYVEDKNPSFVVERALSTRVQGKGIDVAINNYNGFSFVGGLIYKKSTFDKYNTDKHDGSIYSQMYLGLLMVASGCNLFTIKEPLVIKDLYNDDGSFRWSYYRDGLPKSWKEFKLMDGGLPSVSNVLISATQDALGKPDSKLSYRILKRVYSITYPFWIVQYKKYGSIAAGFGLVFGINPINTVNWDKINFYQKIKLFVIYVTVSIIGIMMPIFLFDKLEQYLQRRVKKSY
jgi:glycosyltransferase involved in cell wall biosynthesis